MATSLNALCPVQGLGAVPPRCAPRQRPAWAQTHPQTRLRAAGLQRGHRNPLVRPSVCARARRTVTGAAVRGGEAQGQVEDVKTGEEGAEFSKEAFEQLVLRLQAEICEQSAERDGSGKEFIYDRWERGSSSPGATPASLQGHAEGPPAESQGYGITRVLEGGDVLEKAAANVTVIRGTLSKARAEAMSARQGRSIESGTQYFAAALSLVFHSRHPHIPTFRSDIRFFEVDGVPGWFGGGADLTPFYLFPEDVREFHAFYQALCERHAPGLYAPLKAQCDRYFYLPARKEHRGVGGIFFDDLSSLAAPGSAPGAPNLEGPEGEGEGGPGGLDAAYRFTREVGEGFMGSYWPIAERRRGAGFGEEERQWQLVRRGRYLEFNLLYDRGVRFGMDGNGRTASIMVSAPPLVSWVYDDEPKAGTREAELIEVLKAPRDWA